MTVYRLYFYGGGEIRGRQDFEAETDMLAARLAELLYDACSDRCSAWELWQGVSLIYASPKPCVAASAGYVNQRMQASVIETEEIILKSRWAISTSRRLLEQYETLRSSVLREVES